MGTMPPPLPILPSNAGQPRPTGMLAQSGSASVMNPGDAITGFVNNFLTMKTALRDHYKQKFMEGVQLASQGIPVDNEKLMKYAKKGGLDFLPTEPPTPQEQFAKTQQNIQAAVQAQPQVPGVPQGADPAMQSLLAQAGQFGQAPYHPGLVQRALQGLGGPSNAPVSEASSMGQWLTGLQRAGQEGGGMAGQLGRQNAIQALGDILKVGGLDLQAMSQQQQAMIMGMVKTAVNGGQGQQQALENLVRLGVFKDMPIDEFTTAMRKLSPEAPPEQVNQNAAMAYLYGKMGGPQVKLAQLNMAKDMSQFFGNDLQKSLKYVNDIFTQGGSNLTPAMSSEQYKQYMEGVSTLTKSYPTAPMNLINAVASARMGGSAETSEQLMKILTQYPREGSVDLLKQQKQLGYDYAALAQKTRYEADIINNEVMRQVAQSSQQDFENYFHLATNKELDPTGDAVRAAFANMANALDKKGQIKVPYRGETITLGTGDVQRLQNWRPTWPGGKPYLAPKEVPLSLFGLGGQPSINLKDELSDKGASKVQETLSKYANEQLSQPDGAQKVQALNEIAGTLLRMPPAAARAVLNGMDAPKDMKLLLEQLINGSEK